MKFFFNLLTICLLFAVSSAYAQQPCPDEFIGAPVSIGISTTWSGWYDVSGCGTCEAYCRWEGPTGSGGDPRIRTLFIASRWTCQTAAGSFVGYEGAFTGVRCANRGDLSIDSDGDLIGDTQDTDDDNDSIADDDDNCPLDANPEQEDEDNDGIGDVCDVCPGFDDNEDTDQDGIANGCDLDDDNDGISDSDEIACGSDPLDAASICNQNEAPVAICQDITLTADANCQGTGTIDNGSNDPDGDEVTITLSQEGPYALGTTSVTLTINDGTETAICTATVTVIGTDTDGNGTVDCLDNCPNDANKTDPGICGCGVADDDTDGDGTADCLDNCPNDANKTDPGICGCGVADDDTDGDGTADCLDNCPNDANKTDPGICGCGVADDDTDGDGVADCDDNCIATANPGQEDGDGDGIGDSCDGCPTISDPNCTTCGNNKYLICHVPAGNPDNAKQLCISMNAALNHVGNHGGCFWGSCNPGISADPNSDVEQATPHIFKGEIEYASHFFEVSPNPASNEVNIHLHGHEKGATLSIYDQFGRQVLVRSVDVMESAFRIGLDDARFVNGIYFFTVSSNGEHWVKRVVIVK